MTTDFEILTAETVPNDYTWDKGIPFAFATTTAPAYVETNYVSGYAPGLDVIFNNICQQGLILFDEGFSLNYSWNFGDYYNDTTNNATLSCPAPVRHVYTMPGLYTVTLTHTEVVTQSVDDNPELCRDRYNINWYWDNLTDITNFPPKPDRKTWDETNCTGPYAKQWDSELVCLQKYCRYWSWESTKTAGRSNTTWEQTKTGNTLEKRWYFEPNDTSCQLPEEPAVIIVRQERQEVIKQFMVEVKELLPKTELYSVTRPIAGQAPFTVQLTPRGTTCGSFPIDRIDWDLGDGTPIKTVTRQGSANSSDFIYNDIFSNDILDPRNYDITHTYYRSADQYPVFYPSITAYSANTGSWDACSTTIGPIDLVDSADGLQILKVKNTMHGTLYALDIENSCSFVTAATGVSNITAPETYNVPPNKIRDTYYEPVIYQGNLGTDYPPIITQSCEGYEFIKPLYGLIVEEEPLPLTTPLEELSAITQENDSYIIVM